MDGPIYGSFVPGYRPIHPWSRVQNHRIIFFWHGLFFLCGWMGGGGIVVVVGGGRGARVGGGGGGNCVDVN